MAKTLEHWEAEKVQAIKDLRLMENTYRLLDARRKPKPVRTRFYASWVRELKMWRKFESEFHHLSRRLAKAKARLAYIEERIQALTPTFWNRL